MSVKGFFNRFKFWKRTIDQGDPLKSADCSPEYRLAKKLKRYEKYLSQILSIVLWENPAISILCLFLVNLVFWVFVSLECRFYGILSSILLVMSVLEAWTGHVWPEISISGVSTPPKDTPAHPSVVAMSKVLTTSCTTLRLCMEWLRNLRRQQPGLFCCISSAVCSALLVLGRSVSGLFLVYFLLMFALVGPRLVTRCLPPEMCRTVAQYATCVHQAFAKYSVNEASDDEYMPVTTSEDIALLTRASDLHHDTYDSLTNPGSSSDMASGLELMPSHEEDSLGSLSDLEPPLLPLDPADDTDSIRPDHQIQFQSGHFNGDSSSDEEQFTRDLVFSETDEREAAVARGLSTLIAQAVTSNVFNSVGLLASVIRPRQIQPALENRRQAGRRTDTDSDNEDFEIINRDELNNQDSS